MFRRFLAVVVICATALIGFTAATAVSANAPTTAQTKMRVGFTLGKFVKQGRNLVALGKVTSTATTPDGVKHSVSKPFRARVVTRGFRVLTARSCSVLSLELDKLSLQLLGLNVNLDKVILTISANSNGGALGSLFCKLAHTRVKLTTKTTARHLTHLVRASGLSTSGNLLGVSAPMNGQVQTAPGVVCPILDLVLGPLHLNLLGLVVDLNQVHLSITADPTGGVLGQLFCTLANSTTTAPTTT